VANADDLIETEILDISDVSLDRLRSLKGTALGEAVKRAREEATGPREAVAGFDSSLFEKAEERTDT
jgi:FXSXX-COOH protein